jgi:fatty acid/phospholipid biosynthesis enzyme
MTIAELWEILEEYPDDMELYIGYIDGHSIQQEDFEVIITTAFNGQMTISFMTEDINIINN